MDFRSIYQHGFARVAACTGSVAVETLDLVHRGIVKAGERGPQLPAPGNGGILSGRF